jgi:hypothetical protein
MVHRILALYIPFCKPSVVNTCTPVFDDFNSNLWSMPAFDGLNNVSSPFSISLNWSKAICSELFMTLIAGFLASKDAFFIRTIWS